MTDNNDQFIIAHLTDLHPDGGVAFAHSVALARDAGANLVSLNATSGTTTRAMPNVAHLLESWGNAPDAVPHTAVSHTCCDDAVDTLIDALRPMHPELIVVGTHQWDGLSRAFLGSVSESIAVQGLAPTLVLPILEPGFVDEDTGRAHLNKLLIPVGDHDEVTAAVDGVTALLTRLEIEDVDLYLLRVGDDFPQDLLATEGPGWRWHTLEKSGALVDNIVSSCEELDCDLVVMASRGQDGILDLFRGTRTQQVMRKASRPLLVIPVH